MTSKYPSSISLAAFCLIFLSGCAGLAQQDAQATAESQAITLIAYAKTLATPTPRATPTATPQPVEVTDTQEVTMRLVPAGEFTMGSAESFYDDQKPAHKVMLSDFYLDVYEVTNAAYRLCVDAGTCAPPAQSDYVGTRSSYYDGPKFDDYPVTHADWKMAKTYCNWRDARLPTEAEWEKAARGTEGLIYPWGNSFDGSRANTCDVNCKEDWAETASNDGYAYTSPVGNYPEGVSPYGIYDMGGNIDEWVNDWYSETYYQESSSSNPLGPASGEYRVLRGGAWRSPELSASTISRDWGVPSDPLFGVGFRCARDAAP